MLETLGFGIPCAVVLVAALSMTLSKSEQGGAFLKGAKRGMETSFELIPAMVMLITGVRMLCASGALEIAGSLLGGVFELLKIPKELLPLIVLRPFSGGASTAAADSLFGTYGADSFASKCASVLMACSDTIIYTLSLYFGSVNIKKTQYAFPASFVILMFCIIVSVRVAYAML